MTKVAERTIADLPEEVRAEYRALRVLDDGRICGVHRLLLHWTLHVDIDDFGFAENYCFHTELQAVLALAIWDGTGDPLGWHRHPKSGRRRNLETGEEWVAP